MRLKLSLALSVLKHSIKLKKELTQSIAEDISLTLSAFKAMF